jgi:RNA polymerase sigma-70 factor (ECF subfamily)
LPAAPGNAREVVGTYHPWCRIAPLFVAPDRGGRLSAPTAANVTNILLAWRGGESAALGQLLPLVYADLRQVAHRYMRQEAPNHPLQTTALVHEAYLRLVDAGRVDWQGRTHFYAIAAQVMRRILVEAARRRDAGKRGGDASHVALDEAFVPAPERAGDLVALDEALERLAALAPRKAKVVELRYFGGMSVRESAAVLGVSEVTVMRDWQMAKLWLHHDLSGSNEPPQRETP